MRTQPVEDIDAVIGRFQAWAGSRSTTEAAPGIRELTYEEALASRRHRWKGAPQPAAKSATADNPRHATAKSAPQQKPKPQKNRDTRHANTTHTARSQAQKPVQTTKPTAPPARKATAPVKAKPTTAPPAFREVLTSTVQPTQVSLQPQPSELSRQVAISLRLAPSERDLLRTRATEAGVTVSAYVRQCALEVEQLRAQVKQTLDALEQQATIPAAAPQPAASRPGLLTRLMRRLLPVSTPKLALRA